MKPKRKRQREWPVFKPFSLPMCSYLQPKRFPHYLLKFGPKEFLQFNFFNLMNEFDHHLYDGGKGGVNLLNRNRSVRTGKFYR